jgi:hypothetical protein
VPNFVANITKPMNHHDTIQENQVDKRKLS